MVVDAESDIIGSIDCHAFLHRDDVMEIHIPADMSIHDYLTDQFANQHITVCIAENSYRILD